MILWNKKDGGPHSRVWCWGFESKRLFSVLILRFAFGSREAYHSHAFNSVSWVLRGVLRERERVDFGDTSRDHRASFKPILTYRSTLHQVLGRAPNTWVLSFRGPWCTEWIEHNEHGVQVLTNGRRVVRTEAVID